MVERITCACRATSALRCWSIRYPVSTDFGDDGDGYRDIEGEGGPCQCQCHDAEGDEDDCY